MTLQLAGDNLLSPPLCWVGLPEGRRQTGREERMALLQ